MSGLKDNKMSKLHALGSVPPSAAGLSAAMRAANAFAVKAGLVDPVRYRFLVVFEELITNVVEHGSAAPDSTVDFELAMSGNAVHVHISDAGIAFDPTLLPAPSDDDPTDPEREGGWGWRLILSWCDLTAYLRDRDRNNLDLIVRAEKS